MRPTSLSPAYRVTGLLLLVAALAVGGYYAFQEAVRVRLEQVGASVAGEGFRLHIGQVRTRLFQGGVTVHDIRLDFDTVLTDSLLERHRSGLLTAQAQRLQVQGLSYWALFRHGQVIVERIEVDGPALRHMYRSATQASDSIAGDGPSAQAELPGAIVIDSLIVRNAQARTVDLSGRRPSADLERTDIFLGGVRLAPFPEAGLLVDVRSADIEVQGIHVALPPLCDLLMARMHLQHPSGRAGITGLELRPRANEQHYGALVEHETDLFRLALDTLQLSGLDVGGFLADGTYHLRKLTAFGPVIDVYRDKTLPDAPWAHKPLPSRVLAELNASLAVDTVIITDARVTYHERDTLGPDFGGVTFADLQATITGLDNRSAAYRIADQLRVHATAKLYEKSTIRLDLTAPLDDPQGRFAVSAYVNAIPFELFNRMTDSLLQVEATDGRIHTLVMHMHGNDRNGRGTVDLAYEGLKIAIHRRSGSRVGSKLLGLVANTAIRSNNVQGQRNYRQGEFVVDRRRDRSIFNFLWMGLKAGALDTVVPGILRNTARKATGNSASTDNGGGRAAGKARPGP